MDRQRLLIRRQLLLRSIMLLKRVGMKKRWYWVHPVNQCRKQFGEFYHLYQELKKFPDRFVQYLRMTPQTFQLLLSKVEDSLAKSSVRPSISPEQRLVVTLRFLATGNSYTSLSHSFRMGRSTVSEIVPETCAIIWQKLKSEYLRTPATPAEWKTVADEFWHRWNLPNCLGAVDGKHVALKAPDNSGSLFFNFKEFFSTVLFAVTDANLRLLFIDVGSYGHNHDAGIFDTSELGKRLKDSTLDIPDPSFLPGTTTKVPYYFVGDSAFALTTYMMRRYPNVPNMSIEKRVLNYRLSRARRVVENCFGVLANRWRILLKDVETQTETADKIVKCVCVLHNFLHDVNDKGYIPPNFVDTPDCANGQWRRDENGSPVTQLQQVVRMRRRNANRSADAAETVRTNLMHFFMHEGAIDFQWKMVNVLLH